MAYYYVDPSASGANDGGGDGIAGDPTDSANWTDAWTSISSALATSAVAAGDTVFCRGTETLSSSPTNNNSGSPTTGYIKFIGCNASTGAIDGSRFILDADSTATYAWNNNLQSYIHYENLDFRNAVSHGWTKGGSGYWYGPLFINCVSHDNGGGGWESYYTHGSFNYTWILCGAYNNGGGGFYDNYQGLFRYILCSAYNNTGNGFSFRNVTAHPVVIYGCLSYGNTADGGSNINHSCIINSVFDNNGEDGVMLRHDGISSVVIGSRITNNNTSTYHGANIIDANGNAVFLASYFGGNDDDITGTYTIPYIGDSTSHVILAGSDTDHGYEDSTNDDYNLATGASLRNFPIELP